MLEALILSQCQDRLLYPEDLPYWLTVNLIGYGRTERLIQNVWHWGNQNASDSDDAKPWSRANYNEMLCSLYPDAIPF
jgi:hypothetical protein